jgi:hypothetical protein
MDFIASSRRIAQLRMTLNRAWIKDAWRNRKGQEG